MSPKSYFLSNSCLAMIAVPLMLGAAPAIAQTVADDAASAAEPAADASADIVVTGSRVARSGFEQPTPTVVVGQAFLEQNAAANVADALNLLPQLRASVTPSSNSAQVAIAGKNLLDLRGLGSNRTLVLVDGQRFVPGIVEGSVDVNVIPQALIDNVDIVTGGASAAYGSDAVAGVVNFRLLRKLDGFKGTIQGGITDHNDYRNYLASMAWGTSFADGRGQIILSGEIARNDGATNIYKRDWLAAQPGLVANPAYTPTNNEPANLLVPAGALFSNVSYGGVINSGPLKGIQFGPGGVPMPFNYGTLTTSTTQVGGDGAYLYNDFTLAVPTKRKVGFGRISYEASDAFKLTADFSYADTRARPVSTTRSDRAITIFADNAFLAPSIKTAMAANNLASFQMGRFSSDYGSIHSNSVTKTWRASIGAAGDIGGGWSYDAYYTHGDSDNRQTLHGVRVNANYGFAIDAVIDPVTGAAVCRNAAARAAGCVPLNLFGERSPSPLAVDYVNTDSFRSVHIKQDAAAVTLRGDPFSTWAGPVSVAIGSEYRHESTNFDLSAQHQAFALVTGNGLPWQGKVTVKEAFTEAVVPLAKDMSFARSIDLNLAGRITDYSTSGTVTTWKAGANWAVNDIVRFRATISRDIKAPSMADQFDAGITVFENLSDPVLNQTYLARTFRSGTTNLKPERATTKTLGIVVENLAPGLRASVDYYDINIKGAIGALSASAIVNRCFGGATGFCDLITRAADKTITQVNVVPLNLNTVKARGFDIEADYVLPVGPGKLSLHAIANHVAKLSYDDGASTVRLDGSVYTPFTTVGANGIPHWRGTLSANYAVGPANLYVAARHIGPANINNAYTSKNLNILRVPSRTYVDASFNYDIIDDGDREVGLFVRVSNLFDKDPPLTDGTYFSTASTIYDVVGRTYTAGARFAF